jgi:hypothetical protein
MSYPKLKEWTKTIDASMNLYQFGRSIYKYTDCGPWIRATLWDGQKIYYEDEEAEKIGPNHRIMAIEVGSIVEGWDGDGVGPIEVTSPKLLFDAVEEVNEACCAIWKEVNEEEQTDDTDMLCAEIACGVSRHLGSRYGYPE